MRVRQHAYFGIRSAELDPEELSRLVGLVLDETRTKASRVADPPRPAANLWELSSGVDSSATLDDHLDSLLAKIEPASENIRALVQSGDAVAVIQVVRQFEEAPEDFNESTYGLDPKVVDEGLRRLGGQHPFLSFHLGPGWSRSCPIRGSRSTSTSTANRSPARIASPMPTFVNDT